MQSRESNLVNWSRVFQSNGCCSIKQIQRLRSSHVAGQTGEGQRGFVGQSDDTRGSRIRIRVQARTLKGVKTTPFQTGYKQPFIIFFLTFLLFFFFPLQGLRASLSTLTGNRPAVPATVRRSGRRRRRCTPMSFSNFFYTTRMVLTSSLRIWVLFSSKQSLDSQIQDF